MTFEQIRQYIKGVINGIDFNSHISPMPAEDMSEIITPLPSTMSRRMKYSTEEQVVGEWIDGKPIYQKTYNLSSEINITRETWVTLVTDASLSNVAYLIDFKCGRSSQPRVDAIPSAQIEGNAFKVYTSVGYHRIKFFTIQYTKTTD